MTIRLLRFIPYFSREFGGPVNHAQYLTSELSELGYDQTIYTTNLANRKGDTRNFKDSELDVQSFPSTRIAGDYYLTPSMISALREEDQVDLIHAHCYRNFQTDLAALFARLTNTPLVLTAHGTIKPIDFKDRIIKGLHDIGTVKSGLRWADRCIAVSEAEVDQYLKKGVNRRKIELIHHGVDINLFNPEEDPTDFLENFDLINNDVILYAGRIHERKGLQYLIPAIDKLSEDHENVKLVIAGADYGFKPNLRRICNSLGCENKVLFLGHLDKEMLIQAYNAADLVCYPSKFEIFGHTLTEASACGTPCVAISWGAAKRIIQDGATGRLLEKYGDVDQIFEVIKKLLNHPNHLASMGRQARAHIVDNFSWESCAKNHDVIYKNLI